MAQRELADVTLLAYHRYVRRYRAAGEPDPEGWLDMMPKSSARNARSALRWAYPEMELRWRTSHERAPRALSHEELARVREAATGTTALAVSWLYYTAMRISELARARPEHCHNGSLYVQATKGGDRERAIPLHPRLAPEELPFPWAPDTTRKALQSLGRRIGLHLYPHLFRSTAATDMLEAGIEITVVQRILGHAELETTLKYLALRDNRTRAAIDALR